MNKTTTQPREFWATQILGSEDGNYFMSESKERIDRMSHVEVAFQVVEHSAYLQLQAEIKTLRQELDQTRNDVCAGQSRISKLYDEIDNWKSEYENLCKFATDFEDKLEAERAENEALNAEAGQWFEAYNLQVIETENLLAAEKANLRSAPEFQLFRGFRRLRFEHQCPLSISGGQHGIHLFLEQNYGEVCCDFPTEPFVDKNTGKEYGSFTMSDEDWIEFAEDIIKIVAKARSFK